MPSYLIQRLPVYNYESQLYITSISLDIDNKNYTPMFVSPSNAINDAFIKVENNEKFSLGIKKKYSDFDFKIIYNEASNNYGLFYNNMPVYILKDITEEMIIYSQDDEFHFISTENNTFFQHPTSSKEVKPIQTQDTQSMGEEPKKKGRRSKSNSPKINEPLLQEPVVEETISQETVIEETISQEPVVEETISQETVVEEPVVEETISQEPLVQEPVVEEPVVEETISQEPVVEETISQEPVVEEPLVQEPVVEETISQEPLVEETISQETVVEEPVVEEPVVEETVVEETVVEETVVQETVVQETVVQETVVEEPVVAYSQVELFSEKLNIQDEVTVEDVLYIQEDINKEEECNVCYEKENKIVKLPFMYQNRLYQTNVYLLNGIIEKNLQKIMNENVPIENIIFKENNKNNYGLLLKDKYSYLVNIQHEKYLLLRVNQNTLLIQNLQTKKFENLFINQNITLGNIKYTLTSILNSNEKSPLLLIPINSNKIYDNKYGLNRIIFSPIINN